MRYPALGIDVSQANLAVALSLEEGVNRQGDFSNDAKGFGQLARWVQRQTDKCVWVCLEATGRYSEAIAHALYAAAWVEQVSVLNPSRIHAYGRSHLRRSKTDKADALLLAHYAATQNPDGWIPLSPHQQTLQELMRHRDNLLEMRQQVRNRLKAGVHSAGVQRQLHEQDELLTRQLAEAEAEVQQQIKQDEQLHHQFKLLCSIPGVGPILAAHFLAEVPDITRFDNAGQLAAFAGLVPLQHQSGKGERPGRLAKTGNVHLRTAFYMPALCAARHNPLIATFVARLQAQGNKAKMTIVAAVMHKLLRLAYGVLKSNLPFDPNFAAKHQFAA
jgi:transposase